MIFKLIPAIIALSVAVRTEYTERYRPQLHFSPAKGWLNDPNGLVFHNGSWELYYQYYPDSISGGPKYWGHARSTDLFHWKNLPVALSPTKVGSGQVEIWSGSAIVDTRNVTGYQAKDNPHPTITAFFTGQYEPGFNETQWMAYSTDGGTKWQFYDHNPVIPNPGSRDFRDPKVLEYKDHYIIVVTAGDRVRFYSSSDLKKWTYLSDFGNGQGRHAGVWECCDLFPMTVGGKEKWILMVNEGGRTQYFVGNFDGKTFTNDNTKDTQLLVDNGPDGYAGVTYNSAPDGRRVFITWLSGMHNDPTTPWRGGMSTPRDMKLVESEGKVRLTSVPVKEIEGLRTGPPKTLTSEVKANSTVSVANTTSNLLDIELVVNDIGEKRSAADKIGIEVKGSKYSVRVYFSDQYVVDRFLDGKNINHDTAQRLTTNKTLQMRLVLDTSNGELFADNGLTLMSWNFYTEDRLTNVGVFHESSDHNSHPIGFKVTVNQLKSIWT